MTTEATETTEPHEVFNTAGVSHETTLDNNSPEETQEVNPALEVMLDECRVEMIPLDDIYVERNQKDDDLVKALAHSIGLIGLQNPICVIENDIPGHAAPYRLVSGHKRLAAFLKLKRITIPAHILSYAETDRNHKLRICLAPTEENLVRKHYSLIELCELVGKAKEMYERIHPDAMQGKAPKRGKDSGTECLPKPLAYLDVAAQQLGKSRVTVWKYLSIYKKLIQGHPQEFAALKQCDHPILAKIEDLLALAQSDDIEALTRLLCGLGMTPDDRKSNPCTLKEAQKRLEKHRKDTATQIAELEHATREPEEQIRRVYGRFSPAVQAEIDALPALKTDVEALQDLETYGAKQDQMAILQRMRRKGMTYDAAVHGRYEDFSPPVQAEIDALPALKNSRKDLWDLACNEDKDRLAIVQRMRRKGMSLADAEDDYVYGNEHAHEHEHSHGNVRQQHEDVSHGDDDDDEETSAEPTTRETEEHRHLHEIYADFSPEVQAMIDAFPALKDNLTDLQDFASFDEECQREILEDVVKHGMPYEEAAGCWKRFASQTVEDIYAEFSPELQAEIDTVPALRNSKRDLFELEMWRDEEDQQRAIIQCMRDQGTTYAEAEKRASYNEYHEQEDEEPPVVDLAEIVRVLYAHIDTYFREQGVYETWNVKIRHERNTKGRTRMLISIQETVQSNKNVQRKTASSQTTSSQEER